MSWAGVSTPWPHGPDLDDHVREYHHYTRAVDQDLWHYLAHLARDADHDHHHALHESGEHPNPPTPSTWFCQAHGVGGRTRDTSLAEHEDAEHGGTRITVMWGFG